MAFFGWRTIAASSRIGEEVCTNPTYSKVCQPNTVRVYNLAIVSSHLGILLQYACTI